MDTNESDIIIVGGGAAGLMASCAAGSRALVLEKMPRPARKMMLTGKGRCNFTNVKDWDEFSTHIHPDARMAKRAWFTLPPRAVMNLLEKGGLESVVERDERVFPASHRAVDVVDTLEGMARHAGARILCGCSVTGISRLAPTGSADHAGTQPEGFILQCSDGVERRCRSLILATGGLSYPASGSTGDGFRWAESLGLTLRERFPSLTALVPKGYKIIPPDYHPRDGRGHIDRGLSPSAWGTSLMGISLKNIALELVLEGHSAAREFGEVEFTDGGLEGPLGLRISRAAVRTLRNGGKAEVRLDLKPAVKEAELEARIRSFGPEKTARLLRRLLPEALCGEFTRLLGDDQMPLHGDRAIEKRARRICALLKDWRLPLEGYVGYERCVVTAGGIDTREINPSTMEVRRIPGLYAAGEILDLDCDTGGYNLQLAFCTGYLSGLSAIR